MGVFSKVQLTRCLSARGGYEVWYLTELATVPGNTPALITPDIGRSIQTDEDIFFHGLTAGFELNW